MLLSIDIGGTKLALATADRDRFVRSGALERIVKEPIPGRGDPAAVLARVEAIARELLGDERPERIGIAIGGPLDHARGVVVNFPHLPEWRDVPLVDLIAHRLGAPAALDNDANLGALAEHRFGAGRGADPFLYVTHSTGIGGGIVIGGALLHGVATGAAEVGHVTVKSDGPLCDCGNRGCLERMASGTNIARTVRERIRERTEEGAFLIAIAGDVDAITTHHVVEGYRQGDPLSTEIWTEAIDYLAVGLGSMIHVIAPRTIAIGGGVALAGDALFVPLREALRKHVFYVRLDLIDVVPAELGHDSALIGGMVLAEGVGGQGSGVREE